MCFSLIIVLFVYHLQALMIPKTKLRIVRPMNTQPKIMIGLVIEPTIAHAMSQIMAKKMPKIKALINPPKSRGTCIIVTSFSYYYNTFLTIITLNLIPNIFNYCQENMHQLLDLFVWLNLMQ